MRLGLPRVLIQVRHWYRELPHEIILRSHIVVEYREAQGCFLELVRHALV
jgi:hypothetical protein